ncbi:bifunctional DNA primase/polymerase [Aeromicrobium piscarium]|uniref:DNA primase n=1 Tax=Aeromicrobium piscarium TaxID=2590901 RepID=A0A554S7X4_9ACTN|nr:bifunctional DNA primase/polymerase [Aeromicrobium piscarium]TSD62437.1 DNA primase [Aeromicrobium piscarium]
MGIQTATSRHGAMAAILSRLVGRVPLPAAAQLLSRAGVPVFPCVPGEKRPLTPKGFHDATTDLQQVKAWWHRYPTANLAVPTGEASGVVVVDVDIHGHVNGYEAFDRAQQAGLFPSWSFLVDTPSGGLHIYYPATQGVVQRSWQAAKCGVDFRGDGGYVLIPPSAVTKEGSTTPYRVRQVYVMAASPVNSDGLRDFLDPRPTPRQRPVHGLRLEADVPRLAAWVASRPEGERNQGLFWAACRLAENRVPAADALDVLVAAAGHAGLGEREITATVRSAYRCAHPRPPSWSASTHTTGPVPRAAGNRLERRPDRSATRELGLS